MNRNRLLLFLLALSFLVAFIQIGLLRITFYKLGLEPAAGILLLFAALAGSAINMPLLRLRSNVPIHGMPPLWPPMYLQAGHTVVGLNVGGALIPLLFSLYLINLHHLRVDELLTGIGAVSFISYISSRPIPGLGIGMPVLVAPLSAALVAVLVKPELSAPLAYVSGTLGVLIGADLLRLKDIRELGVPQASIGGAGTFDGIFITGIVAVLLA